MFDRIAQILTQLPAWSEMLSNPSAWKGKTVTFVNPFSLARTILDWRQLRSSLEGFDLVGSDGVVLSLLVSQATGDSVTRRSFDFTSLATLVFDDCMANQRRIGFVGGTPKEMEAFARSLRARRPTLDLVFTIDGYFRGRGQESQVIQRIVEAHVDYVIIGMGFPYQEDFAKTLRANGVDGTIFTCGGFIKQTGRAFDYYPPFFDRFNLRWLYRMLDEPQLILRYVVHYSVFLTYWPIIHSIVRKRSKVQRMVNQAANRS